MVRYCQEITSYFKRGLKDDTTILFFADHNAYSNQLAHKIKGYNSRQSPLMRLPAFVVSPNLKNITLDKFTCAFDFLPTLLQLMGINYNPILYLGEDAFCGTNNVITSKIGGVFNHLFYTFDGTDILWKEESATEEDFRIFQSNFARLKEKWDYIDALYFFNNE